MKVYRIFRASLPALALLLAASEAIAQSSSPIKHVLLISIDGMHSLDFANCSKGVPNSANDPYCPHLSELSRCV